MKNTLSVKQRHPAWLNPVIKISAVITIIGFIPWKTLFSLESQNTTLAILMSGTLGLVALFFLLCFLLIRFMPYTKRFSGLHILLTPIIFIGIGLIWMIGLLAPPQWKDQALYRNGKDYLVLEGIIYYRGGNNMKYRLIVTNSPYSTIRHISEQHDMANNANWRANDKVFYKGKMWYRQTLRK